MLNPVREKRFKTNIKIAEKRGKNMQKLATIITMLIE